MHSHSSILLVLPSVKNNSSNESISNAELSTSTAVENVDFNENSNVPELSAILPNSPNSPLSEVGESSSSNIELTSFSTDNAVKKPLSSKVTCLPDEYVSDDLRQSLDDLKNFVTVTVNLLRRCNKFRESTLNKLMERVSCFLNFCRIRLGGNEQLNLNVINNFELVQEYIDYQLNDRKLNISTVVRCLTALINLANFVHRMCTYVNSCVELTRLRDVQRHLSVEQREKDVAVKAGLHGDENRSRFMYSHILKTVRNLREKVEEDQGCSDGEKYVRTLHDFVLICVYLTSMCGRSKELYSLQLFDERKKGSPFQFDFRIDCNVLVYHRDQRTITIYENDFKTVRTHGPSKFVIDQSMWILFYLKKYIALRESLLRGKLHKYLFLSLSTSGRSFTSSSFSNYLAGLFQREVNVRAVTNKMRHAMVTYVMSLPESESLKLQESLASLMRHSLKHQQQTYCDISRQDQTSLSRDLLNKSVEVAANPVVEEKEEEHSNGLIGGGGVPSFGDSSTSKSSLISWQQHSPAVGDVVALVDGSSTCYDDAAIFLAVIRFSKDESEALLMEFREIAGEQSLYHAVVDSSWCESTDSLIFPVDVVWDRKRRAYELRSSVADIYGTVNKGEKY